uniref:Calcitonin peptide-like domain-containing protein n=1 Tax=Xiphophorus maculatus TaxID=8083 RepID=A0A3B5Q2S3_XIPMA
MKPFVFLQEVISTRNTMYHLRVPVFLLAALVLLRCIAAAPSLRYFSSGSSDDNDKQENALPDKESRSLPELIADPFSGLMGARPERGLTATNSHHLQKRMCKFSTCHRERLAHKLSVLAGKTGKKTTDVGKNSFGKREIHLPPAQLP